MTNRLPTFTLPALLMVLSGLGCQTFSNSGPDVAEVGGDMPQQPMIMVEMQSGESTQKSVKLPLASAPTLQAAVEQSKADHRFKRFHIAISRLPQNSGGQPQTLVSKYDHVSNKIPFDSDYALRPGDRVVIVEDKSSVVDDMLGSFLNPMRALTGSGQANRSPFQ
ncbi:MAG: hypothetical protein WDZ51_16590 [Pirellulaceae bacterium]